MIKEKNYKLWYVMSAVLLIVATVVHLTGYVTNMLYILAWALWMPVITLCVVTVFDIMRTGKKEREKLFSKDSFKGIFFLIMVIFAIYVIFNLVYNFTMISDIADLVTGEDAYYVTYANGTKEEITYSEYVKYSLASYRMLSGHMLLFIAAPLWYYDIRKKHM